MLPIAGLNDYSLLLGIAGDYSGPVPSQSSTDPATPAGPAAPACKASRKFYNGIPDVDNTEMYYVGIIDILTAFEGGLAALLLFLFPLLLPRGQGRGARHEIGVPEEFLLHSAEQLCEVCPVLFALPAFS